MKKSVLFLMISLGTFILIAGSINMLSGPKAGSSPYIAGLADLSMQKDTAAKVSYTCPMHPEVARDKAGKCPKCGMNLVTKEVKDDAFECPMHPEVTQERSGKCPKCGMTLVKKETAIKAESAK